ncbi:MAG TPA: RNA polymerase sigma factor [Edaphobacter sp.]|nr:RNA polymerase sigma factor [Edaphobacter sp.]
MTVYKTGIVAARLTLPGEEDAAITEQEFQALYDATSRSILAYLIGMTGHRDIAEDLLQETYCRFLVRQPAAMEAEETRRYLFRIATNLLRDRWRKGIDWQEPVSDTATTSPDMNSRIDVQRTMQALKPRERELLWLAYVEGMNHTEIAETIGITSMSVRLLLFRARRKAAALLRPTCDPERSEEHETDSL